MALTLTSATVASNGGSITLAFTAGTAPVLPASGAVTFTLHGTTASIASVAISGTTGIVTLNGVIYASETPTLNYTAGDVTDSAVSPASLASFADAAVTNNSTATAPAGTYCTIADVRLEMGTYNEQMAADPDANANAQRIAALEQRALDKGTDRIHMMAANVGIVTPLTVSLNMVRDIAAKISAWELYQIRGVQDDGLKDKLRVKYDDAVKDLGRMFRASVFSAGTPFALVSNANPQSIAPAGTSSTTTSGSAWWNPFGYCGWW